VNDGKRARGSKTELLPIFGETERWLAVPLADFSRDTKLIGACQGNLELLVKYASDINGNPDFGE
jgi:hypothetical protein